MKAFAVKPGFAAVDIAYVDEIGEGRIFGAVVAFYHKDMIFR